MELLLDIGNSRIKWALVDAQCTFRHQGRFSLQGIDSDSEWSALRAVLSGTALHGIAVASVASEENNILLRQRLSGISNMSPWFAKVQPRSCGVRCAYTDCRELGVDRWSMIIGAWSQVRGALCVIDYGTAVSMDVVDDSARHLGGYVFPGLAMMQESLRHGTARIQVSPGEVEALGPGVDTASCVGRGCLSALVACSEHLVRQCAEHLGCQPSCLVTGGDAARILPAVCFPSLADPYLLFRGLHRLFRER